MMTYGNRDLPEGTDERPLVTFALFAYNQEKYIREAVEGAFSQTYSPLEIILSDDCSSDRTFEIMQEMAAAYEGPHEIILRRNNKNLGLAGHLNEVLQACNGLIISWAAGDDISLPDRTEFLCQPIIDNHDVVSTHSPVIEIDTSGNILRVRKNSNRLSFEVRQLIEQPRSMTTQSHAFRRIVYETFGTFRTDLTHEGYPMTFREASLGKIKSVDLPLTKYRIGSGVSTYNGKDVKRLKELEPIKISLWHYTSSLQIYDDINNNAHLYDKFLKKKADRNIKYFKNIYDINASKNPFIPFIKNITSNPFDLRSFRALFRRLMPNFIYRIIKG